MSKLFVYGIFLSENMREQYGMQYPRYAVVNGYKTVLVARDIVEAIPDKTGALTGLIVDVPKEIEYEGITGERYITDTFERLDRLERAYNRVRVVTTQGEECFMYVAKQH